MKNILSVIAGLFTGILIIWFANLLSHKMYPLPFGMDLSKADWETMKFFMGMAPIGVLAIVLVGYVFGSLAGGFISSLISKKISQPLFTGGALMLGGIIYYIIFPHPIWFSILSVLVYLPFAFIGGKIGLIIKKKSPGN